MYNKTSHATKTGQVYVQTSCQSTRVWQRHRAIARDTTGTRLCRTCRNRLLNFYARSSRVWQCVWTWKNNRNSQFCCFIFTRYWATDVQLVTRSINQKQIDIAPRVTSESGTISASRTLVCLFVCYEHMADFIVAHALIDVLRGNYTGWAKTGIFFNYFSIMSYKLHHIGAYSYCWNNFNICF